MRGMLLVARRELAAYLNSYWGYAVIAAVLVIDGLPVSYTHLDVYKRQSSCWSTNRAA